MRVSIPKLPEDAAVWSSLRSIGNSGLAKASIFVPIVGYLILFNSRINDFLRLHTDYCAEYSCSVSWRMLMFYFGLSFVGAGTTIYSLACPRSVKAFASSREFLEATRSFYQHPVNQEEIFEKISMYDVGRSIVSMYNDVDWGNPARAEEEREHLDGAIMFYYESQDTKLRKLRISAFALYSIGAVILAIPTIVTFLQVLDHAVRGLIP